MNRRRLLALLSLAPLLLLGGSAMSMGLTHIRPRDPARRLASNIPYGEGPYRMLDVYGPETAVASALPVVVFFHSGGWYAGSRTDYAWAAQALASRGFLVVTADYRLFPEVIYPSFVEDAAAAVRWTQDHAAQYGGDPQRILLMGHSAGAHIAMQLALDDDFLKAAGVDPARIRGVVGMSGPYDWGPPYPDSDSLHAFTGYPYPKAAEPITYAGRPHRPPVLLIHGGRDDNVAPISAVNLDRALKAAGNPSTLLIYPTLGHMDAVLVLSIPYRYQAPVLDDAARFLKAAAQ